MYTESYIRLVFKMITADDFAQETWTFFKNVSILRFYGTKYFENEINQYNGACLRSSLNFDSITSTVNIFLDTTQRGRGIKYPRNIRNLQ